MPPAAAVASEWRKGWRTLLAAAIGSATGLALYAYIVSLFLKHHVAEFGWSRGDAALASMATLTAGLLAPFVGRLTDQIGIRPVILVGATGFAGATVGLATQSGVLWHYYGWIFLLVFFGLGTTSITWARAVSGAFDRSRGLALSLALSGVVISAAVMQQALNAVMEAYGWRAGWLLVGATGLGGALIALVVLPPTREPVRQDAGVQSYALVDAIRSRAFWCLVGGMFLINIPSGGLMNQMAALISDKGYSGGEVATIMSAFAASVAIGRLIAGFCLDRFAPPLVAFIAMALPAVGCVMLLGDGAVLWAVIAGIVFAGLSQGAEGDIGPYIVSRYFGLPAFGVIMGSVNAGVVSGTAFGGILFGQTHDLRGDYDLALWIGAGCFLVGATLFLGLAMGGRKPAETPAD
jgi:MFS family permease